MQSQGKQGCPSWDWGWVGIGYGKEEGKNVLGRRKSTHSGSKSGWTLTSGERWEILREVTIAELPLRLLVTIWNAFPCSLVAGYPSPLWFTSVSPFKRWLEVFLHREEEDTQGSGDLGMWEGKVCLYCWEYLWCCRFKYRGPYLRTVIDRISVLVGEW